jgi:hypothetical protein
MFQGDNMKYMHVVKMEKFGITINPRILMMLEL